MRADATEEENGVGGGGDWGWGWRMGRADFSWDYLCPE